MSFCLILHHINDETDKIVQGTQQCGDRCNDHKLLVMGYDATARFEKQWDPVAL